MNFVYHWHYHYFQSLHDNSFIIMQENKKIELTFYNEADNSEEKSNIPQKSHYQQQYKKVLETIQTKPIEKYIDQLFKNHIIYDPSYFNNKSMLTLSIKIAKTNQYGSCLTLLVTIGPFTLNIEVANAYVVSQTHSLDCQEFGNFGDVYFVQIESQKSAIKCLKYKLKVIHDFNKITRVSQDQQNEEQIEIKVGDLWKQSFVNCLKQYCFYRIFSALGIGPRTKKILGFDIVCYENCFEFSIEVCNQSFKQPGHDLQKQLLYCLKVMHLFHIVHRDIKPQNMLFSPQQNQLVLTDFGTTIIIRQEIGYSTFCEYVVGTYGFFCKEMEQRYEMYLKGKSVQSTQIDFYYNDLFGIRKSIQIIYTLDCPENTLFPQCYLLSEINLAIWIGSLIENEKIIDLKRYQQKIKGFAKWILDFTRNYLYTYKQKQMLESLIQPFIKTNKQINQYSGRFYLKIYEKLQQLSEKQMSQIQERKIEFLLTFKKVRQVKQKEAFEIKSLAQAYLQSLFSDLLQIGQLDFHAYFTLKEFFIQLKEKFEPKQNKHDSKLQATQRFEMYYFQCSSCHNVLILEQQYIFSTRKLNLSILGLIEEHISLDEQHSRMLQKLKLYLNSSDGAANALIDMIKQSKCPIEGLNHYFKLLSLIQRWTISDSLAKIYDALNNFISQIVQEDERNIIRRLLEWRNTGKVSELKEIEQLYYEYINSSFLMKHMKYGLIYLGLKIVDLNLAFKCYNIAQTIQQELISHLKQYPDTLSQKRITNFFYNGLIHIYDLRQSFVRYKIKQIRSVASKFCLQIPKIYMTKLKEALKQYFTTNQIENKLNNCCLPQILYQQNMICLQTQSKEVAIAIKKAKSMLQLDLIPQKQLRCNFQQNYQINLITKKYKTVRFAQKFALTEITKVIQRFMKSQKLDFEYLDFRKLIKCFGWLRKLQIELDTQNILRLVIDRLSNKISKHALQVIFYSFKGMKQMKQIEQDQNKSIQDIYELMASQILCQHYLCSNQFSLVYKGKKILENILTFIRKNQLGYQYDFGMINYYPIFYLLVRQNRFNDIFCILEKSLINLFVMRCFDSIFIVLHFNQVLSKLNFTQNQKKILNAMQQRSFAQIKQLEQGIFLYVNLLIAVKQTEKMKVKEKEDRELTFWYELFDLIKKHLFTVSKLSFCFLRSSLCFTIKRIFQLQKALILKNRQQKSLFRIVDLIHPKKKKLVLRNYTRYVDCFISDPKFFFDRLYSGKRNHIFKRIELYDEKRMSKLVRAKRKTYKKNVQSIRMICKQRK